MKMAGALAELAQRLGADVEVSRRPPALILVSITTKRGLQLTVELDGKSIQPDTHVLPWHMHYESDDRLAAAFGAVNPHHFRKATQVAEGWEQLRANVERGLTMAADGSAFKCAPASATPT